MHAVAPLLHVHDDDDDFYRTALDLLHRKCIESYSVIHDMGPYHTVRIALYMFTHVLHVFLVCTDETHTHFTLLHMSACLLNTGKHHSSGVLQTGHLAQRLYTDSLLNPPTSLSAISCCAMSGGRGLSDFNPQW